ncbi:MAG: bifunctional oligoribonuclease/PAP phosphatase NrnA [Candidatus Peribacter sp.]|jgi:bifunctional oligoribonuclease and PAP phosphatase NrnA|nr:bifunctional oligoribonuclease/PAP phosphatase NrnA [Candidatus Peribacter sp.]MBT4392777.1 bifunctional oligoribonuclease/PAP phosphatase NrnA [Candidatus Peribacter sp.]MBT4600606.1 bifunctional oligoribonuclease/PAP phosphatase NrnA [Candidatus Peribacter sp.]MBT5148725.1 bifunctional oligoribonuclease/PAP phosphatase NrnA [Candidatus Peribacter sp.]MBT5637680.1 bifunctional oligoribonuclease/PAP phosphatase NrnA [Candidatus Peribacter sp.]
MPLNNEQLSAATSAIQGAQRIMVVPHANVDPDGLGSALACQALFTQLGKDVTVICPDSKPDSLSFLPGFEKLQEGIESSQNFVITINLDGDVEVDKLRYTVEDGKVNIIVMPKAGRINQQQVTFGDTGPGFDLIVAVDTADLPLMGKFYTENIDLFTSVPILNIDHHISNTNYGQLQMIDTTAASATEVLYDWFTHEPSYKEKITPDMATLLLTGLITDTRSFQNPNTTPRSLEVAAELLERGARQQEIVQHIYKTKPLSTLKIWGRALNKIQMDIPAGIVWSTISKEDLAEMEAHSKESSGILDELISTIPDADIHVLFTEVEEGGLKASMRSSPAVDVSRLSGKLFGGGGHPRAAGFRIKDFDNFDLAVMEAVQKLKTGMQEEKKAAQGPVDTQAKIPEVAQPPKVQPKPVQKPAAPGKDIVKKLGSDTDTSDSGGKDIIEGVTQ